MRTVQATRELQRILGLPRRPQIHDAEGARQWTQNLRTPWGEQQLRPIQATAFYELWRSRGLFGPMRVGAGKTLITLLAPLVLKALYPVLVLPAKLIDKTKREMVALAKHWRIPTNIRIYSYEMISHPDHVHLLRKYPLTDLIIADECHKLRNVKAAVTRRFKRHFETYPATPFIGLSGSITKRSIRDYEHLLRWALKPLNSPLPRDWGEVEDWADALDEHTRERPHPGALVQFTSDLSDSLTAVRQGYRARLIETPGVVTTIDNRIDASLLIRGMRYRQGPAISEAFEALRTLWELPDGTPLVDGMSIWRHARELALGFWMKWDPPPPEEWRVPRAAWAKACRAILSRSRTLDSEGTVMKAIDAGAHREVAPILAAWRAVKDAFEPNPVPVWIDDGPVEWAADWGRRNIGIIWTDHVPFAKELAKRGNYRYYGRKGTDETTGIVLDRHDPTWTCVASIKSGSEGFNLQAWENALVTAVVPNGSQTEQLLGRMHRDGTKADEVTYDLMIGCREHLTSFWRAVGDARFVKDTTGEEQKLLYADIDVPQDIIDPAPQWQSKE